MGPASKFNSKIEQCNLCSNILSGYLSQPTRLPPFDGLQSFAGMITSLHYLSYLCTRNFSSRQDLLGVVMNNYIGRLNSTIELICHLFIYCFVWVQLEFLNFTNVIKHLACFAVHFAGQSQNDYLFASLSSYFPFHLFSSPPIFWLDNHCGVPSLCGGKRVQ